MPALLLEPPAVEPVSVEEARLRLREIGDALDAEIARHLAAARRFVEERCERALVSQRWRLTLDAFPERILLPRPPLLAVDEIRYLDPDGVEQVLPPADWQVSRREPALVVPAFGKAWPATRCQLDAVTVDYTAGYGDAAAVPEDIKNAMLLLVALWHENAEAVNVGNIVSEMPFGVESLLAPYRIWTAG